MYLVDDDIFITRIPCLVFAGLVSALHRDYICDCNLTIAQTEQQAPYFLDFFIFSIFSGYTHK